MSKTIGYLRKNAKVPQRSEFTASKDESNAWQCNYVFICRDTDVKELTPNAGDLCPRPEFGTLECVESSIVSLRNQPYSKITSTYAGTDSEDDGGGDYTFEDKDKTFTTTYSSASDPIESHERYKDLTPEDLKLVADFKSGNVRIESGAGAGAGVGGGAGAGAGGGAGDKFYVVRKNASAVEYIKEVNVGDRLRELIDYLSKGITVYYSPRIDFSMSWVSKNGNVQGVDIGTIDDNIPSPAPKLEGDANYLYLGAETRKKGANYSHRKTWKSSASGGWDETLYKKSTPTE